MIKAVFLDVDNTLLSFDGYVIESMKSGFAKFGLRAYEDWMFQTFGQVNTGLWHDLEKGLITFDDIQRVRWNLIFKELGIDFDGVRFEEYFRDCLFESAIEEDGALELVKYLSGKYVLCSASNGPYGQQVNRLKKAGMFEYFTDMYISEDIGAPKPSKEFFEESMKRLNAKAGEVIAPEEVIIIGDSLTSDIKGGVDYGMKTCFYNPQGKDVPADIGIDYVVGTLKEIMKIDFDK